MRPVALHEPRRKQLTDGGHIDPIETRRDDRRTGDADVDFPGPAALAQIVQQRLHRRAADNGILDEQHALAHQHFPQRRVLQLHTLGAILPFDERAADVAIADESLDRRDTQSKAMASAAALPVSGTGTTMVSRSNGTLSSSRS